MKKLFVILGVFLLVIALSSCKTTEKVVYVEKEVDISQSLDVVLGTRPDNDFELVTDCKDMADVVNNSIVYLMQWEKWEEYAKRLEKYLAELRTQLMSV